MIRRWPFEYFAKSMLVQSGVAAVHAKLTELGYEDVPDTYLHRLREDLQRTRPMSLDVKRREVQSWLKSEKIHDAFANRPDAVAAKGYLRNVRLRPTLEMLVISGLSTGDVISSLNLLGEDRVSPDGVETFRHYFWNRDIMSRDDWKQFLTRTADQGWMLDRYPNGRDLMHAYLGDPQVALWKVGVAPQIDEKMMIATILGDAYMRWLELKAEPNTGSVAKRAEAWWNVIRGALEEQRIEGHALAKVYDGLHRMSLQLQKTPTRDAREVLDQLGVIDIRHRLNGKKNGGPE